MQDAEGTTVEVKHFCGKEARYSDARWRVLSPIYTKGADVVVSGRLSVSKYNGALEMVNPDAELPAGAPARALSEAFCVEPIYGLTQVPSPTQNALPRLSLTLTDPSPSHRCPCSLYPLSYVRLCRRMI